jgi:1-aminocyclopropane-1-carboxylate deaminase
LLKYLETPLFELKNEEATTRNIRLLVKREDLNHPFVSGNKWWKLKYNLEEVIRQEKKTVLTFGGAFSNHIYATAAAASELGLNSIGIIRGEETIPLNQTLTFAREKGMQLHYVPRDAYRNKTDENFISELTRSFGAFYLIPEGGTNEHALKGCAEWGRKLLSEIEFDYLCLPVGTGGTIAGLISGFNGEKKVIGFSSLKGNFLEEEVSRLISSYSKSQPNWRIENNYHFGGYGKVPNELSYFIESFENKHSFLIDPVYTAKMIYGVFSLIAENYFREGSTILLLHTGGLQGRAGFNF